MMKDIISILVAFVLGYGLFISSIYFLAQWTFKIKTVGEITFSGPDQRLIRWTFKEGQRIPNHNRKSVKRFLRINLNDAV